MATVVTCLGFCQTARKEHADPRARAEALARSCSAEFDDPQSAEYKQCTEAIEWFERRRTREPHDISVLLTLGRIYENRSLEKSIEAYRQTLVLDSGNVTAHFELGLLLHSPQEQIMHFRAVLEHEPNHPEAHGRLAGLLAATSQTNEAVEEIKKQIAVDPNRVDTIDNVMESLRAKGHKNEAAQVLAAYLRSSLPARVRCADSQVMLKQYADRPDVIKVFEEQCPGYVLQH